MKLTFFIVGSMRVLLQMSTSQRKSLFYYHHHYHYHHYHHHHYLPVVEGPGQGGGRVEALVGGLALVDPLSGHLDLGPDEVAVEQLPVVNAADLADILSRQRIVHLAGLLATWKYSEDGDYLLLLVFILNMHHLSA